MYTITQPIIITDRITKAEIGCIHIDITPKMNQIAIYRTAHIAVTEWGEANGRIFNELDWHWQPLEVAR